MALSRGGNISRHAQNLSIDRARATTWACFHVIQWAGTSGELEKQGVSPAGHEMHRCRAFIAGGAMRHLERAAKLFLAAAPAPIFPPIRSGASRMDQGDVIPEGTRVDGIYDADRKTFRARKCSDRIT